MEKIKKSELVAALKNFFTEYCLTQMRMSSNKDRVEHYKAELKNIAHVYGDVSDFLQFMDEEQFDAQLVMQTMLNIMVDWENDAETCFPHKYAND